MMFKWLNFIKIFFSEYILFLQKDVFISEYKSKNTITALRFALLNHALIIASLVLFANVIYRFCMQPLSLIIIIDLIGGLFFFSLLIWFNMTKKVEFISVFMSSMMVIMGIALLSSKHTEATIYIWTYTIPITTVFVSGYKKGFTLSTIFYIFALFDFWFYYDIWEQIGWDYYAIIRYFITSFILLELCIIADFASCSLQDNLYTISSTDSLTNLNNRQKIEELLQESIEISKRFNQNLCICIFDIDDFKNVNDTYGHLKGDDVLKKISSLVSSNLRSIDNIGRWGGEEFILIFPNSSIDMATKALTRVKKAINSFDFGINENITCSFGLSLYDTNKTEDDNIMLTDNALYKAKTSGKNKICINK